MARSTPWGNPTDVLNHIRGISSINTKSSHGLMVSKGVAETQLSESAKQLATLHKNYYCFEKDLAWIPVCEIVALRDKMITQKTNIQGMTSDDALHHAKSMIEGSQIDYRFPGDLDQTEQPLVEEVVKEMNESLAETDTDTVLSKHPEKSMMGDFISCYVGMLRFCFPVLNFIAPANK